MKIENAPLLEYTATSSYASLQKATEAMCKHRSRQGKVGLCFSIFETSANYDGKAEGDWIVDHPDIWSDKPVFTGDCVFFSDYWRIADHKVESEIFTDPCWEEIINECARQLIDPSDGSTACLFLEGFKELEPDSCGVTFIELVWGS
jgi:hypothetical protein